MPQKCSLFWCFLISYICDCFVGCCEWDKITHWEMLECPDLVKCADLQCHDLWFGLGLNESEHLEHLTQLNCSKQDFRDFCSETCLAGKYQNMPCLLNESSCQQDSDQATSTVEENIRIEE